jgi:hypothetical protein
MGNLASMGQNRHERRIVFGNPDGNRSIGRRGVDARVTLIRILEKL